MKKIRLNLAANILIAISVLSIVYHLLILSRVIPFENVWGGRLKTVEEMYSFETISLIINVFIILLVAVRAQYLKIQLPKILLTVLLWLFVIIFSLNTVGNIVSLSFIEAAVFTPITLLSAFLFYKLTLKE